jgi:gliding motility-associated-like protein
MRKLLVTLTGILLILSGYGQISHNADTVIPVKYNSDFGHDSIYVVFGPGPNGFSDTLHLEAYFPFGQSGTIKWYAIARDVDQDTLISTLLSENQDTSFLSFSTIFDGGYRVELESIDGTYDTTITFWAFFNNLQVEPFYEKSCTELAIYGISGGVDFYYFNPDSLLNDEIIDNGYVQIWEDYYLDPIMQTYVLLDSLEFDSLSTSASQANQYFSTPPIEYDNYMFTVKVKDSLGHTGSDTLYYQAIAVQVAFEVNENDSTIADEDLKFSGPVKIAFKNNTKNAEFYRWTFFNDTIRVKQGEDTVLRRSTFFEPLDSVLYTYPGYYDVKLRAEGPIFIENGEERSCVDSVTKPLYITIYKSFVGELPNVVIPGNEEYRFFFRRIDNWDYIEYDAVPTENSSSEESGKLRTVSMKKVEVYIYNRYGLRVFHHSGSNWTAEEGWDGKYNGQKVGSGVYYYWIRAWGLDNRLFQKKGFFHVFSKN